MSDKRRHRLHELKSQPPMAYAAQTADPIGSFLNNLFSGVQSSAAATVPSGHGLQHIPFQPNTQANKLMWGIARIESAGGREGMINYGAVGPYVPKHHDRAYGGYQVMGKNLQAWWGVSPQEFLKNPAMQDQLVRGRFESQLSAGLTPREIAHDWIGHAPRDVVTGYSSARYADNVARDVAGYSGHHHLHHGMQMRAENAAYQHGHHHPHTPHATKQIASRAKPGRHHLAFNT